MKELFPENCPQFYTATKQGWKHLLKEDKYKDVIVDSLKYLVDRKKVKVNAFIIMDNHVHFCCLCWSSINYKRKINRSRSRGMFFNQPTTSINSTTFHK